MRLTHDYYYYKSIKMGKELCYPTHKSFITLYNKKEKDPASVGVNIHPTRMVTMVFLLIDLAPFTRPTPTTAPTMAEEVDLSLIHI